MITKEIKVGKRYKTIREVAVKNSKFVPGTFDIFYQYNETFYGINLEKGYIVEFDIKGEDEWKEFGGHWWKLNLDTETEAQHKLIGGKPWLAKNSNQEP